MQRTFVLWMLLAAIGVLFSAASAFAAVITGTIESVDAAGGQVVVNFGAAKADRVFRVADSVEITLDGKPAKLSDLTPSQRIAVQTSSGGRVLKVVVRSGPGGSSTSGTSSGRSSESSSSVSTRSGRSSGAAAGWTQFRGPNRDNRSQETGLLKQWPQNGPRLAWKAEGLGDGYSTVSVSDGLVLTMGNQGNNEAILALDLATGQRKWAAPNGPPFQQGRGNGPRGTPSIDGDRVYGLGGAGNLSCVDLKSGQAKWQKNILREFGGSNIGWGISESVLIDGEKLICTPGGRQATMAALDKNTGRTIWTAEVPGSPQAGYASPIAVEVGGVRQYVTFTSRLVVGVRANDGQYLWSSDRPANGTANCSTPVFAEGLVFAASGYGTGGTLLELSGRGNTTTAREVYHTRDMKNHHGGMVVVDDYLYGSNDPGMLVCLELKSGRVVWQDRSVGKGSVTYADGHIYLRSEGGPVALVEATPKGYVEKGRFNQPNRSDHNSWPHPVVADGKLFLRDMDVLLAYDVRDNERASR